MKKISTLFLLLGIVACSKTEAPVAKKAIAIEPVITKATETDFEEGDQIGVTITRGTETYAENKAMTYDGTVFQGDLFWYSEGEQTSNFCAYYPYAATAPVKFTVNANQAEEGSYGASDLMIATKNDVSPQAKVTMVFQHMLTRIVVVVDNQLQAEIDRIVLSGSKPTGDVSFSPAGVTVDAASEATDITLAPVVANQKYAAIVIPQTVTFTTTVYLKNGKILSKKLAETTLKAGGQYTINMVVIPAEVSVSICGEIQNWNDEGTIAEHVVTFNEYLTAAEPYFEYDGVNYKVVKLQDNNWWMAQNLAFVPDGMVPCQDLNNVAAGIYYPVVVGTGAAKLGTSPAEVAANGYLYQSEVALGKSVNSIKSQAEAEALAGARGICPPGWHIPTIEEYVNIVGKAVSPITTKTDAPYYNGSNGSIALLNADGFNINAYGAINIGDNTKTSATLMGYLSTYSDRISSGYICGSSYAGITKNTDDSIKNIQFWGLMPMTNKSSANEYTCNGSKLSYKVGASVRCIRDKEN